MIMARAGGVRRKGGVLSDWVGFSWKETKTTLAAWIRFREAVSPRGAPLSEQFARLADQWKLGIGAISDPQEIRALPGFAELVRLGQDIIPLVLKELDKEPTYWFEVLADITGHDPTPSEHAGDVDEMISAWKRWAAGKNLG
jgi:hypothetical protein